MRCVHRPLRADRWLLYARRRASPAPPRGLACGQVFTQDGQPIVSVMREGLGPGHRTSLAQRRRASGRCRWNDAVRGPAQLDVLGGQPRPRAIRLLGETHFHPAGAGLTTGRMERAPCQVPGTHPAAGPAGPVYVAAEPRRVASRVTPAGSADGLPADVALADGTRDTGEPLKVATSKRSADEGRIGGCGRLGAVAAAGGAGRGGRAELTGPGGMLGRIAGLIIEAPWKARSMPTLGMPGTTRRAGGTPATVIGPNGDHRRGRGAAGRRQGAAQSARQCRISGQDQWAGSVGRISGQDQWRAR